MPIDLVGDYGYSEVVLHAIFPSADVGGKFVSAFASNSNKSVRLAVNNGNYRRWACTALECKWFVSLARKRIRKDPKSTRKRPETSLIHVPDNSWYISKMDLTHMQCCPSTANPTGDQIARMPAFRAGIVEGHNTSKARTINNLKQVEGVDVSRKHSVLHRVISDALKNMESDDINEFQALPAYMELFASQNPGSRVCCQLDSFGRFFRSFLCGSHSRFTTSCLGVRWHSHQAPPLQWNLCYLSWQRR